MAGTISLRQQNASMLSLLFAIRKSIAGNGDALLLDRLLSQFDSLSGLLDSHFLALEQLFPPVKASPVRGAAWTAMEFEAETADIERLWDAFHQCWKTEAAIRGHFERFRGEAEMVLTAVQRRIEREEDHLYPLADRALALGAVRSA